MLTTKPTAKHHNKPALRCRRCNKLGHKAAHCRSKGYTGHRGMDGQPRNSRENPYMRGEQKHSILQDLQCFVCGGPHKARECAHRYDSTSKRPKISEDSAPQRKFEGKMYMLLQLDTHFHKEHYYNADTLLVEKQLQDSQMVLPSVYT